MYFCKKYNAKKSGNRRRRAPEGMKEGKGEWERAIKNGNKFVLNYRDGLNGLYRCLRKRNIKIIYASAIRCILNCCSAGG